MGGDSKVALNSILKGDELGHVVHSSVGQHCGHCALLPAPLCLSQAQLVMPMSLCRHCTDAAWNPDENCCHAASEDHLVARLLTV